MDLRTLQYFIAAADCGSLSKGAKQLYISESAVSMCIKNFESEIGFPVFVREHKRINLTDAGAEALGYAKKIMALVNEMKSALLCSGLAETIADGNPGIAPGKEAMSRPRIRNEG